MGRFHITYRISTGQKGLTVQYAASFAEAEEKFNSVHHESTVILQIVREI